MDERYWFQVNHHAHDISGGRRTAAVRESAFPSLHDIIRVVNERLCTLTQYNKSNNAHKTILSLVQMTRDANAFFPLVICLFVLLGLMIFALVSWFLFLVSSCGNVLLQGALIFHDDFVECFLLSPTTTQEGVGRERWWTNVSFVVHSTAYEDFQLVFGEILFECDLLLACVVLIWVLSWQRIYFSGRNSIAFDKHLSEYTLQPLQLKWPHMPTRPPRRRIYTVSVETPVVVERPSTVVVLRECWWDSLSLTCHYQSPYSHANTSCQNCGQQQDIIVDDGPPSYEEATRWSKSKKSTSHISLET